MRGRALQTILVLGAEQNSQPVQSSTNQIFSMPEGEEVLDQDANDQVAETTEQVTEDSEIAVESEVTTTASEDSQAEEPVKRPEWSMPVSKAQEEKRRAVEKAKEEARAEKEAEIQRIKQEYESKLSQHSNANEDAEIRKFAEEKGLDPDAAVGLAELIKKSIPVPDTSRYEEILKEKEIQALKAKVSDDFDKLVLPLLQKDYPSATPQHIAEVKNRISDLAFTQGYNTYRLEDIYRVKQDEFEFKNGFSAEASGGRSSELVDFSKMTDEEEHALAEQNPAKYAQYIKEMAKKGSRYSD